jgi:hypothetical protein
MRLLRGGRSANSNGPGQLRFLDEGVIAAMTSNR